MLNKNYNSKEIGSEFWDVPISETDNNVFDKNTRWFISGTSALEYIIADIINNNDIDIAAIPSWCCSCMITPFLKNNIKVKFYPVYMDKDNHLVCDYSAANGCDICLVMSYFGYVSQRSIGKPSGIIIRDITHSIFSKKFDDANYYFGSLRKWAGFWTGGYAWVQDFWHNDTEIQSVADEYVNLRKKAMNDKQQYIKGITDSKEYLELFERCEEYLDSCDIVEGDIRDIQSAQKLNVSFIKEQRRKNAEIVLNELRDIAIFPYLQEDECPLFVPIVLPHETRNHLRNYLIRQEIFCPIHWGESELHKLDIRTRKLYEEELSLVCDQRYTEKDMIRAVNEIKKFMYENKID